MFIGKAYPSMKKAFSNHIQSKWISDNHQTDKPCFVARHAFMMSDLGYWLIIQWHWFVYYWQFPFLFTQTKRVHDYFYQNKFLKDLYHNFQYIDPLKYNQDPLNENLFIHIFILMSLYSFRHYFLFNQEYQAMCFEVYNCNWDSFNILYSATSYLNSFIWRVCVKM